jgi:hypothetical protein
LGSAITDDDHQNHLSDAARGNEKSPAHFSIARAAPLTLLFFPSSGMGMLFVG